MSHMQETGCIRDVKAKEQCISGTGQVSVGGAREEERLVKDEDGEIGRNHDIYILQNL